MYRHCLPGSHHTTRDRPRLLPSHPEDNYHGPNPLQPRRRGTTPWTDLMAQERNARYRSEALLDENLTLKKHLAASHERTGHLQSRVRNLRGEIDSTVGHLARAEDDAARYYESMKALKAEVLDKSYALRQQKKRRELADFRVGELSRTISVQYDEIAALRYDTTRLQRIRQKTRRNMRALEQHLDDAWRIADETYRLVR